MRIVAALLLLCGGASLHAEVIARVVDQVATPGELPLGMAVNNGETHLFVAQKTGGLVVYDIRDFPRRVATVPTEQLGKLHATNVAGAWSLASTSNQVFLGYIQAVVPFRGKWTGIKAVEVR
ncbi:MAG: hypothetical protein KDA60_08050 [Planctomycetales bacterium]|nr:hypothetical protein [Planctomycetales bacterium]